MILAGDIGGTTSRLGLFDPAPDRPREREVREFRTTDYGGLTEVVQVFLQESSVSQGSVHAACFGVAGPVLGATAALTNVPFSIDSAAVGGALGIGRVALLNDLAAMAFGVGVLHDDEVHVLQAGSPGPNDRNLALIAAGTGLGQAALPSVNGVNVPCASEAGHADWAPRTERDILVLRYLTTSLGRAEVEQVVSGMGLRNLHVVMHREACAAGIAHDAPDVPSALSKAALAGQCNGCVDALEVFVDAYGAEAGNLALRSLATAGVYVGGGIAPKILPALTDGRFLRAFNDKGAMRGLVERIPVRVILHPSPGLLGAAVHAAQLSS